MARARCEKIIALRVVNWGDSSSIWVYADPDVKKKFGQAQDKDRAHYDEQEKLREIRDLREGLSPAKLSARSDPDEEPIWCEESDQCGCEACTEFREELPKGEPVLSSLLELPAEDPDDAFTLCTFTGKSADQGREFDWFGELDDNKSEEYLPRRDDISISVFLVRKMDSKRLELTADAYLDDARYDEDSEWDEDKEYGHSFFEWDLSMKHARSRTFEELFEDAVRFEAKIKWRDAKEHAKPPDGLDDDEMEEWEENKPPHEPELLLSSLTLSLLREKTMRQYDEYRDEVDEETKSLAGPDELLAMLRSSIFEGRWA